MNNLDFEKLGNGLIPTVIQDNYSNKVLMLGFMNKEAFEKTQKIGKVTFYSRTKKRLWTKGEESGNFLDVVSILSDCDNDTLLIRVNPRGPVCHKGTDTCFKEKNVTNSILFLQYLQDFIDKRKKEMPEGSYTSSLFNSGVNRMAQKVGEEALETVIEATNGDLKGLKYEAADLLYHLIVLLSHKGMSIGDLADELKSRHK
ncbi:MAG: bifunctional phosphoribosyl-AMP cyclohydrolase/phosphoribosyl-ATP diphosphatase HisIE [Bacteroidales bacterium]